MKKIFIAMAISLCATLTFAKADLEITDARIFTPLKGSNATAGYGLIKNKTKKAITLSIVKVQPFKAVELHETIEKDGRMSMQKKESFILAAGQSLELKPGGNHIMLFDAENEVRDGEMLKVEFTVNGESQSYDFKIIPRIDKKVPTHNH